MKALGLLALAAALGGCGAAPFDYHAASEIKQGPGAFSGNEGAFVYRPGQPKPAASGEAEEFERWKRSAEGSAEYREFQDWREWREWKRQNAK